jgi:hypothetical protein
MAALECCVFLYNRLKCQILDLPSTGLSHVLILLSAKEGKKEETGRVEGKDN